MFLLLGLLSCLDGPFSNLLEPLRMVNESPFAIGCKGIDLFIRFHIFFN